MERVVIIGAGAHGREVAEILRQRAAAFADVQTIGYIDEDTALSNRTVAGLPVLGSWNWFSGVDRRELTVICASGFSEVRKRFAEQARRLGLRFAMAISPDAYVSPEAALSGGTVIYPNATVGRDTVLGHHSVINVGAIVSHDTKLDDCSTLNPGVNLAGNVSIGEGCYLGIGCNVVQGISIGPWTTVGAGAVVIADLPANVTAVGVPARVIETKQKGWHEESTSAAGK